MMPDIYTDSAALDLQASERLHRRLRALLAARLLLLLLAIPLVFFLLRWSSAVESDELYLPPGVTAPEQPAVVIPQYGGSGRGSTLLALKPWRFGTVDQHPLAFSLCVALAVAMGGAFVVSAWYSSKLKARDPANQPLPEVPG